MKSKLPAFELVIGLVLSGTMILLICLSRLLFPDGGETIDLANRLAPPFAAARHPFGTDALGRDILARLVCGGKISLVVGSVSVVGSVLIGTLLGLVAGYYGRFWDGLVMRFADIQLALPFILLAITFLAIVGGSVLNTILLLVVAQWVQYARLVRGACLGLKEREFIQATRAIGVRPRQVIFVHLLPNVAAQVIVLATLNVANNILLESSLTFLGLGADPSIPSWGGMLSDGRTYLQSAWWMGVFPGLALLLLVLGLNLLGDWLRDAIDPMSRETR